MSDTITTFEHLLMEFLLYYSLHTSLMKQNTLMHFSRYILMQNKFLGVFLRERAEKTAMRFCGMDAIKMTS